MPRVATAANNQIQGTEERQIKNIMRYYRLEQYSGLASVFKHLGSDTIPIKLKK